MFENKLPAGRLHSSPAVLDGEADWTTGYLVEFDAEKLVEVKCCLRG